MNKRTKEDVLDMLANGLRGNWQILQIPGISAPNFLKSDIAREKCRKRFESEVRIGRMIGGPG